MHEYEGGKKMESGIIKFNLSKKIDVIDKKYIRLYTKDIISTLPFLKKEIIDPITDEIKKRTGYSDKNIPKETEKVPVNAGGDKIIVEVTPTIKRPGYEEVYSRINGYLDDLERAYKDSREQEGIRKFEGNPYVDLPLLIKVLDEYKKKIISIGIKQELLGSKLEETIKKIIIPIGVDFSKLPDGSLEILRNANRFYEDEKNNVIESLENLIFKETGFGDDKIPNQREDYWNSYGNYYVHAISSPKETMSYGKMVNALIGEGSKKTAPGELILIANRNFDAVPKVYSPKESEGRMYIALFGIKKRLKELADCNRDTKINQVLKIYSF